MRVPRMRLLANRIGRPCFRAVSALLFLLAAACGAAAEEPPVFAISNARIVTMAGPPIEKGTVVFRNGVIEAVGKDVHVPGDARVVDGTGLTVYPGIIDALSEVGLDETRPETPMASSAPGTPGTPVSRTSVAPQQAESPDERQGLTPYRRAVEVLNPASRGIESARAAGITTALVAPRGRIFAGLSSLFNLSGGDIGRMVVKTTVAFHINMAAGAGFGRGYPASLMGVIAFIKQTLLDAGQYGAAWDIYSANPGVARPEYSRPLETLRPLITRESPVIFPADNPTEIRRVMELADSFKLNLILSGAAEAGSMASILGERKIPILLSVKYPEKDRDADPEIKEELGALRRRVEAPANAAGLAKAGVKFAFQSRDMKNPRDFIRNIGKAIDAGLDKETALRSLTLVPAEIFGVADRLGSIEKNKTANLIVTTGDIFDAKTKVKFTFVDGRMFEITEPVEPPRDSSAGKEEGDEN